MLNLVVLSIFFISSLFISSVYAEEPILITESITMEKIIFDGKWTDGFEWKESSYDKIKFNDNTNLVLRSAHYEDFIYFQINTINDFTLDKGSDSATLCFDTKNDKTVIAQDDDYCFFTTLNGKNLFTFQGGSPFALNGNFKKIPNHKDYVSIGNASGKYDRYEGLPHPVYEFRIPIEVIGRSDNYGFYFSAFDASSYKIYSWPTQIEAKSLMAIPSPDQWGDIISPDKSLPELNMPIIVFAVLIFTIILVQSKQKIRMASL